MKILEAALHYVQRGFAVMPLQPNGKKPLSRHGSKDASKDEAQVREWWAKEPNANVGIVTGAISGVIGVDVDEKDGRPGHKNLLELMRGIDAPTATVQTPTGGLHLYFKIAPDLKLTNRADLLLGIDVRGEGGYLVAPPSTIDGKEYRWVGLTDIAELPVEIAKRIKNHRRADNADTNEDVDIAEGGRNHAMASLAGALRRKGVSRDGIMMLVKMENDRRCKPALPVAEIEQIVGSIMRYTPQEDDHLRYSDTGNAVRFVAEHGANTRYVAEFERWYTWDSTRWHRDIGSSVFQLAHQTVEAIYFDALQEKDPEKRKVMIKYARGCANTGKLESMLRLVRASPRILIPQDKLDRDPWLFGINNGVLDLRSGAMCEARREDMITQASPVTLNIAAKCDKFEAFLARIFEDNAPLIEFVQRAVGYSLTGDNREQVMFFAYGGGANGKSTLLHVLNALLGDYSRAVNPDMFLERQQGSSTNDLARLRGARLVTTVEVGEGKRMAEELVKRVTGGDKITARFLFAEFFEFEPTFKIWLAANHKPVIRGTDHAIWRRIRLVPFNVKIPEKEQDGELKYKLVADELPGILNWAINGCLSWQRQGLNPPPEVLAVTEQYRDSMDTVGSWLNECCIIKTEARTPARELYLSYKTWSERNGEYTFPESKFKLKMEERGYTQKRGNAGKTYEGIGVLVDPSQTAAEPARDLTKEI